MKLLVVGGAGYVGTILRPALEAKYECRYFDQRAVPGAEDRTIVADVNDQDKVKLAVQGVDAILYLAMGGQSKDPHTINDLNMAFSVNVQAVYRFLSTGLAAGVRKFVYASTLSVFHEIFEQLPLTEERQPEAWEAYGLTKRLGEQICLAAGQRYPNATVLALRLIQPKNEADWTNPARLRACQHAMHTGPQDTRDLFLAALACEKPGVHIVNTSGDLSNQKIPNDRVFALLGWKPQGR